ncbi:MAG: hypothetical protein WBG40_06650, partial [Candidatus Sulfotelmatobacter sp.]
MRLEQMMKGPILGIVRSRVIPFREQLMCFWLGEERQFRKTLIRIGDNALKQSLKMTSHPADRGSVKNVGVVS